MINRRNFLCAASLMPLTGCMSQPRQDYQPLRLFAESPDGPMPLHYGPLPLEQFPVPAVPLGVVEKKYWRRRTVSPFTQFAPGRSSLIRKATICSSSNQATARCAMALVLDDRDLPGQAMRP